MQEKNDLFLFLCQDGVIGPRFILLLEITNQSKKNKKNKQKNNPQDKNVT